MRIITIIVAAGRGTRAGDGLPKQYRPVGGLPLLTHTLHAFLAHDAAGPIVCAIHPDDRGLYDDSVRAIEDPRLRPPVAGGATRQASVRAVLESLAGQGLDDALCLVHDAARPFVSAALIGRAIAAAERHGAAVPGMAVTDTVKRVGPDGAVRETVPRETLRVVQTPQAFRFGPLLDAHRRAEAEGREDFTDDGHLAEWAGLAVHVFEGDPLNSKVTHPSDFADAERRLAGPAAAASITRVGTGFDVHAFAETGDHVWLGGVRIDHDRGVLAHSDGDVVLHALTDALLGALCDGDIGTHFPPSDPPWRGAASDRFLAYAADKVRAAGGVIDHLDATVLCERPRVGPYREAMRAAIAAAAGIPPALVSIKATTTEKLGFTGRREGLAAQAAATIRLPVSS